MSRDPFDRLRDANPVPDDAMGRAPMEVADRIVARRRLGSPGRRPGWLVAVAAAAAVLVAGGAWMLWLGSGETEVFATDPTSATTAAPPVTATAEVAVFLLADTPTGPALVPVPRTVNIVSPPESALFDEASGALAALIAGPTADEAVRGLATAIPEGVDGPPLAVWKVATSESGAGLSATVFVPHTWLDIGYPTPDGLAQIVFTLTAIDGIDGVEFALDDSRVPGGVVAGSGDLIPESQFANHPFVDRVVTRITYEGWMPLAFVESPAYGASIQLPFAAHGVANSVGNQVRLTLEVDERTLWQETVTATCGTPWSECRGEWDWAVWEAELPDVGYSGYANLTAEVFGSGVEVIDSRTYPVTVAGTAAPTTTTVPEAFPDVPAELAVYMLMDADSTHLSPGPHLVPVSWMTAVLSAPLTDAPRQAMEWLLQGPLPGWEESVPAITTAIPEGTRLLGLEVEDGVATVDLSEEFLHTEGYVRAGGHMNPSGLAQVVFTLTRFNGIDAVQVLIEGTPILEMGALINPDDSVFSRADFEDLLPAIMIETPMYGSIDGAAPLHAEGTANVFEATVSLALTDADGLIVWEGFTTATCGTGCRGDWSVDIPYTVDEDQRGSLIVWESSARDGSQTNVREHPVWLIASGDGTASACSGAAVPDDLPDQDLPDPIAATRRALFEAALACDWDALAALADGVNVSFGAPADPIAYLQQQEAAGYRPMWWLAQTLRLPQRGDVAEGPGSLFVWPWISGDYTTSPSLPGEEWTISERDAAILREIYTPEQIASFEEFGGFIGYRVGIDADGIWRFFVAGD